MKSFLGLTTLVIGLAAGPAGAVVVDTSAGRFDVGTVTGSFNDHAPLLQGQVWFGNAALAGEFAAAVALGAGSYFDFALTPHGPAFTYLAEPSGFAGLSSNESRFFSADPSFPGVFTVYFGSTTPGFTFAVAQAVPDASTWAMMLAGLGGVAAAVRRRRRA